MSIDLVAYFGIFILTLSASYEFWPEIKEAFSRLRKWVRTRSEATN